ncbi:hypothetical protein ACWCXE_20050 [Streptomyces sp. NPDC001780]
MAYLNGAQEVRSELVVDFGLDEFERRVRPPRARYDCGLCRTREGPVHGADAVAVFVASIRIDHPARCTARSSA